MCNAIPRAYGSRGAQYASPERNQAPPPKYHPEIWRDVGRGFLKALLDAEGVSLWSRLPLSKFKSLERVSKRVPISRSLTLTWTRQHHPRRKSFRSPRAIYSRDRKPSVILRREFRSIIHIAASSILIHATRHRLREKVHEKRGS